MTIIDPTPWVLGPSWVEGPTGTFTYTNPGVFVADDALTSAAMPDEGRYYRIQYTISGTNPRTVNFGQYVTSDDDVQLADITPTTFNVQPFGGSAGNQIVVSAVLIQELPAATGPIRVMNPSGTAEVFTSPGSMIQMQSSAVLPNGTLCVAQPIGFGTGEIQIYNSGMSQIASIPLTVELTSTFVTTDGTQFFVLATTNDVGTAMLRLFVLDADGTIDRTVDIQDDAGPIAFVPYSVAVTPDGATLLVGCQDVVATVDTTTGVIGSDFATETGSIAAYGGVRCLSNGDVLVLWQTDAAPQSFTLRRYSDGGVSQATDVIFDWDNLYTTPVWSMPLMVTPDEASVWVVPSGPDVLDWTPWYPTRYAVADLSVEETLTAALRTLDGFVAPTTYVIPN